MDRRIDTKLEDLSIATGPWEVVRGRDWLRMGIEDDIVVEQSYWRRIENPGNLVAL